MFICIFAEVLNQINIKIMAALSYYEARISALECANQELKIELERIKLQLLKSKVQDPNYDKKLSEINVNYEIVKPC